MIALAASLILALYVVVPGLLFRALYRLFIPWRNVVGTTTEQATRAVITTIFPFILALLLTWYFPTLANFPVHADHPELRATDYRLVFLFWYYLSTALVGLLFGYLVGSYGKLRSNRWYRWFADKSLFSRIWDWHPLLTAFVLRTRKRSCVRTFSPCRTTCMAALFLEHFVDGDGKLTCNSERGCAVRPALLPCRTKTRCELPKPRLIGRKFRETSCTFSRTKS